MHSQLSLRIKATPALLACTLGLFSGSVIAAENWQTLPPNKIGAAITDQIDSNPDLSYARYGERELQLDLFRPRSADRPLPAIVCIHRGGWQSGNRLNHGHLAKALAARGFVAVSISYRLSCKAKFPVQIHDAKAAVRWLCANAKQWGIDPDAIGTTGLSAGGHLTALLATSGGVDTLLSARKLLFGVADRVGPRCGAGPGCEGVCLLDMARRAVNVFGDTVGAVVVAKSEGETLNTE
jgi:acetyl esterase/lipase